jgi:glycosyltransferase involved in cell wall biosynthesis
MITIIIPCYNEEEIIKDFINELHLNVKNIKEDFEIIFINNKSNDKTIDIIKENIKVFTNYKIISLSNYFGKEAAILSGLDVSKGQATIVMDPDLEDPPKLITTLIDKWKEGYDVVYAKRKTTETTLVKKIMRKIFYLLFKNFVNQKYLIPENTGDFRLLNQKVVSQIINMRERTRFLRGLVSFIGYKQFGIEFDRPFRKKGNSKSNISFLIKYGFDAIFSSTSGPAGLITKIGIFSISIVFFISTFILINKFFGNPYEGFSLTMLLILFLFSLNTLMIGIVGEYVTRIYDEVKQRPHYIIEEIIDNEKNL